MPTYLPVVIKDEEGRMTPGAKSVNAQVSIESDNYKVVIFVPPVQKREPTASTPLFKGTAVPVTVKILKSGKLNTSGCFSKKKVLEAGKEALMADFTAAAEAIWNFCN